MAITEVAPRTELTAAQGLPEQRLVEGWSLPKGGGACDDGAMGCAHEDLPSPAPWPGFGAPWRRWRDALGEGSHRGAAARDLHASALTDERGAPRAPPSRSPARAPREVRRCAASRVDANPRSAANARRRRTCPAPTPSQSWLPRPSKARPTPPARAEAGNAGRARAREGRRREAPGGSGIIRQHDTAFRVVEERVNGAHAATFAFDDDDLLTQAGGLTITREPASGFVTQATAGLVTEAWTYSDYGEVETYTATVGGVVQIAWSYVRDDLGRIVEKTETTPEGTRVLVYEYDLAARLSAVYEDGLLAESYGYDDNGNRLSSLNADGVFDAAFDEQDRLLEYGDESFTWTDNGELLACTDTATGDTTTYAYDAVGNLRGVGLPSGDLVKYLVDGRGRRVGKKLNGVLERGWLWRGQLQPVAELDGAGNVVARFVYAGGVNVPALMVTESATYRLVTDHLGSVRRVVDVATGAVVQELEYDSWGRVLLDTNPGLQPFGFAGGLYDSDTGLVRFGSRDYDAETGRWTTKDPIRFGGGVNLFEYAQSSPIARKDPTGRDAGTLSSTWVEPTIQRCCGDSRFGGGRLAHCWICRGDFCVGFAGDGWSDAEVFRHTDSYTSAYENIACEEIPEVDDECVGAIIYEDASSGWSPWVPFINDCQTYVDSVINECMPADQQRFAQCDDHPLACVPF